MSSTLLTIVTVFCCYMVLCSAKQCPIEDSDCLTKSTRKIYAQCLNGELEGFSSADPLHLDFVEGKLPTLKYTVTNATLAGIKTCMPELVRVNPKDKTFDYHVACKHLTTSGLYEVKGELDSMNLEGKGDYKIDLYEYVYLFHGNYEVDVDKTEKLHIQLKNYKLDIDAREKVVYDIKNLFNGDKEKSDAMHKYVNENWKSVDKSIRQPLMEKFMVLLIENANGFLKIVPIDQIFKQEE